MQYCLGAGLNRWATGFIIAYAKQPQTMNERAIQTNDGVMLRLYQEFSNTQISAFGIYWFDEFQFNIKIQQVIPLPRSHINLGLNFEQISSWSELSISAGISR